MDRERIVREIVSLVRYDDGTEIFAEPVYVSTADGSEYYTPGSQMKPSLYREVLITPPEQITPPYFQESGVPGNDGLVLIPAPGVGKFVAWSAIASQSSDGYQFTDPGAHVYYQGLSDPDYTVNSLDNINNFQVGAPDNGVIIPVSLVENLPVLVATSSQIGTIDVNASLLYRVWYQIYDVVPTQVRAAKQYYSIYAVDQGAKKITVNDTGLLNGATGSIDVVSNTGTLNGTYTIESTTFDDENDKTDIVTVEALPDDTADGWIKQ